MTINSAFWTVVVITIAIYVAMVAWALPVISADAGGLMPFDMRPGGYSFDQASKFLAALSERGNSFYRNVQHRLDLAFPFFEALATGWAIFLLAPTNWGSFRWPLAVISAPGMVFDYLENASVAIMLNAGTQGLNEQMVAKASYHTLMKSIFVTISLVVLVFMIVHWFLQKRRAKK